MALVLAFGHEFLDFCNRLTRIQILRTRLRAVQNRVTAIQAERILQRIETLTCCNVFLTQHFLGVSDSLLPGPVKLGRPFLTGSELWIRPRRVFGPFVGSASTVAVPPDPALPGFTFAVQAVPVFFTTIGLATDYATTQAVEVTFL